MNKNIIEGNWEQLKGDIQKTWGKLTDDQMDQIEGSRKKLVGFLQENYGIMEDEAEKQVSEYEQSKAA